MPLNMAIEVTATFADEFFELLASQQYVQLGRMFLVDSVSEHFSTVTQVDAAGRLVVFQAAEIPSALTHLFAPIARKTVVIEDVTGTTVSAGVSGTISFSSEALRGTVCVLLEHCDDETFFVRNMTVRVTSVAPPLLEQPASITAAETLIETPAPAVEAPTQIEAPAQVEEPVVAQPAKGKGKAKKATQVKAAPVEEPVAAAEPEVAPVAAEPAAEEVAESPAPEPVVAAPVAPAPSAPKSWATLARKPGAAAVAAPVVVRPPGAAPAEPAAPAAPVKEVKEAKEVREPKQPRPEIKDRLMFTISMEVTDDDIKAALGPLAKSVASLRNQSKSNRVFVDFTVDTAFDTLTATPMKFGEFIVKIQRQHQKA
jgi:hypothetical protein